MKIKICPICVVVSGLWLVMSAGIAWGYLSGDNFKVPVALLMGGTVVGIAFKGEERFRWALRNSLVWKTTVTGAGMLISYLFIINLGRSVVVAEFVLMLIIAYIFFVKGRINSARDTGSEDDDPAVRERIHSIEEKMKQCC